MATASSGTDSDAEGQIFVPVRDAKKQVDELMVGIAFPESAQNSMDALANLASDARLACNFCVFLLFVIFESEKNLVSVTG